MFGYNDNKEVFIYIKRKLGLIIILFSFAYPKSIYLQDMLIESKANGLILKMHMSEIPKQEHISAWQANSGWFYITLYNVKSDGNFNLDTGSHSSIFDAQTTQQGESYQIGLNLKRQIENYEFSVSHEREYLIARLHYPVEYLASLNIESQTKKAKRKYDNDKVGKKWLFLTGLSMTAAGMQLNDRQNLNLLFSTGVLILAYTVITSLSVY